MAACGDGSSRCPTCPLCTEGGCPDSGGSSTCPDASALGCDTAPCPICPDCLIQPGDVDDDTGTGDDTDMGCVPSCAGLQCGPDGCGGTCGSCDDGFGCTEDECVDGICVHAMIEDGTCKGDVLYDCATEGWCNAVTCPSDGNPCTLEVVLDDGLCGSIVNQACAEPLRSLVTLFKGAQAYYQAFTGEYDEAVEIGDFVRPVISTGPLPPLVIGPSPPEGTCCQSLGGPPPCDDLAGSDDSTDPDGPDAPSESDDTPGATADDGLCVPCPADMLEWELLGFYQPTPHRYVYSFEEVGDGTPGTVLFEIRAQGDLDCDGLPGTFVLQGSFEGQTMYNDLSVLETPPTIVFTGETSSEPVAIDPIWAATTFAADLGSGSSNSPYEISYDESYFSIYREPLENLVAMGKGLARWVAIPLIESCLACQVPDTTEAMVAPYLDNLPTSNWSGSVTCINAQGATPIEGTCCASLGGPDLDGDGLCDPYQPNWYSFTWAALDFSIEGSHEYVYSLAPSDGEDNETVFTMGAEHDPLCQGIPTRLQLSVTVSDGGSSCAVEAPSYMEITGPQVTTLAAIDLSLYNSLTNGYKAKDLLTVPYEESFSIDHADAITALGVLADLMSAHYQATCTLPPWDSGTPIQGTCCSNLGGPDLDGDGLCEPDPTYWLGSPWAELGFSIDYPSPWIYSLYYAYNKPTDGKEIIGLRVSRDLDCDGIQGGLQKVGIADPATCSITWLEGFELNPLE